MVIEDPLMGSWLVHLYADVAVDPVTAERGYRMDKRCHVAVIASRVTIDDLRLGTSGTLGRFAGKRGADPEWIRITKRRYPEGDFIIRA